MRRPWLRPLILTLVAGTAGAALQMYAAGGITEVSPSRIATLTVAILLGPWHGIAATLLAAIPGTVPPFLLTLRLVEALIVGAAARRGHSPLFAGGLFLLVLALALGLSPELFNLPSAGASDWARAMQMLLTRWRATANAASMPIRLRVQANRRQRAVCRHRSRQPRRLDPPGFPALRNALPGRNIRAGTAGPPTRRRHE